MESILVVDDDVAALAVVKAMLEYLKHRVSGVNNCHDALTLLRGRQHFDVAIVDLVLPGCSGIDLARQIRAEQPSLPIIIISGYISPESTTTLGALQRLGITQILLKPVAPGDLDIAISAVLLNKPRRRF